MKLLLFDIDGTLISVKKGITLSLVTEAIRASLEFGGELPTDLEFHGKTDRQIFLELAELLGFERAHTEPFLDDIGAALIKGWKEHLNTETVRMLEGVRDVLDRVSDRDDTCVGLLTGNLEESARIKLEPHDLHRYFQCGSYGSDSMNRLELPPIALQRANSLHNNQCTYEQTLIIRDSHRDIACAKAWGIRTLAVATGALSVDQLTQYSPDSVCETLASTDYIDQFLNE